jgi:hypothetical protein
MSHWDKLAPGTRHGRWTVVSFAGRNSQHGAMFRVRCECGKERVVFGPNLTKGKSVSCGCYRAEYQRAKFRAALSLLRAIDLEPQKNAD